MKIKLILLFLSILITFNLLAERTITGRVLDESKEPLIGANVIVFETDSGIVTDFDGYFELIVPDGKVILQVTYTGFENKKVEVKKNVSSLEIIMKSNEILLESVVISNGKAETRKEKKKDRKYKSEAFSGKSSGAVTATVAAEREETVYDDKAIAYDSYDAPTKPSPIPSAPPPPPVITAPSEAYMDVVSEMSVTKEMEVLEASDYEMDESVPMDGIESDAPGGGSLPAAGQLTGGILNDFGKWNLWQDIAENELYDWQRKWNFSPMERFTIQLTTQNAYPIINAKTKLISNGNIIWESRTDNTGKAEMWANMFDVMTEGDYSIQVTYKGESYDIESITDFHEGINIKKLPVKCDIPNKVDVAFVVDATGSMGDEIEYLKSELNDVIGRVKTKLKDAELRLGSVFYRDHGDAYLTRKSHFSTNVAKTVDFIKKQGAAGGGDGPEAIEEALDIALNEMAWSEEAAARLLFLVLDAPPHETEEIKIRLKKQIGKASKMGVRIIPVACSGTDRSTEYLMRSFSLATNGSYIYLTDDSGIGGSHLKPITDEIKVNLLNDILVNTITDFSETLNCDEQIDAIAEEVKDTSEVELIMQVQDKKDPEKFIDKKEFSWKYFPNPTSGNLNVELEGELDYMYLLDGAGKLLQRIKISDPIFQLDLKNYPSGIYYLRGIGEEEREVSGKVILARTY